MPKFLNNQKSAIYQVKDTIFIIQKSNGQISRIYISKKTDCLEDSPYYTYLKGDTLFIRNVLNERKDSILNVSKSTFLNSGMLGLLSYQNGTSRIIGVKLNTKNKPDTNSIYYSTGYIKDFSTNKDGSKIIFFAAKDSTGDKNVDAILAQTNGKGNELLGLNDSILPKGKKIQHKKRNLFFRGRKLFKI